MGEHSYQFWLQMTTYGIVFIFGTIANLLVMVFFGFKMQRHSSFRWLIIQLSIVDCICCIFNPLLHFYIHFNKGVWNLGIFTCKALTPIGFITVNVSAWILCAIAYERYRAIAFPLRPRLTKTAINIICGLIWLFSIILSIPYVLRTDVHENSCRLIWTPTQNLVTSLIALVLQSIMPSLVMALAFFFIQQALQKQKHKLKVKKTLLPKEKGVNNKSHAPSKAKLTTQALRIACVIFVLCSLPYNIVYVLAVIMFRFNLYTVEEQESYSKIYEQFAYWFSILLVSNSFMNSFIYAGKFPRFRKFIWTGVCCCCKKMRRLPATEFLSNQEGLSASSLQLSTKEETFFIMNTEHSGEIINVK